MMDVLTVKRRDRYATTWDAEDENGPIDLTGATVRLLAKRKGHPVVVLTHSVPSPTAGVVQHVLDGTLPVGDYQVELEITRGLEVFTAPSDRYVNLRVIPDLG